MKLPGSDTERRWHNYVHEFLHEQPTREELVRQLGKRVRKPLSSDYFVQPEG